MLISRDWPKLFHPEPRHPIPSSDDQTKILTQDTKRTLHRRIIDPPLGGKGGMAPPRLRRPRGVGNLDPIRSTQGGWPDSVCESRGENKILDALRYLEGGWPDSVCEGPGGRFF